MSRRRLEREPDSGPGFSEAEFVRILRVAADLHDRTTGDTTPARMSLAEIEHIAAEVGIPREHVAAAALLVGTEASERFTPWLGTPVRGRISRVLPAAVAEDSWQELTAVIRETMRRPGQHSYVPGALEWVHSDEAGEVRVEVSASRDRTHVQISADHRQGAVLYLLAGPALGGAAAMVAIVALGLGESVASWGLLGGGAATGLAAGWLGLRATCARWQRRMRGVLQAVAERAVTGHADGG